MNVYFQNVLKGFINQSTPVKLASYTREKASFIVTDIDRDDMPEIIFAFKEQGESYIGVLKKSKDKWYLEDIKEEKQALEEVVRELLEEITLEVECFQNIGKAFRIEDLFENKKIKFIGLIDDHAYYCSMEEQTWEREEVKVDALDFSQGDVTGNGSIDNVYIGGSKTFGEASSYAENLQLIVREGLTQKRISVPLDIGSGYNPSLFLGDFTGDDVKDILITVFGDGEGAYMYAYIYSMVDGEPKLLFDYKTFNEAYNGSATYKDYYKVEVEMAKPPKIYEIDISQQDEEYLASIYDENGDLDQPIVGNVSGLIALNPLDYDRDRVYELSAIQRISDTDKKETIGLIETFLEWQEATQTFEPVEQYAAVYGKDKVL